MKKAVSDQLHQTIFRLQSLPTLSKFFLVGGTNLAFRLQHRESLDIDLFCSEIIGFSGFEEIKKQIHEEFSGTLVHCEYGAEDDDQIVFLKVLLIEKGVTVKAEIIQNMKILDEVENVDGIRMASIRDIGLFKLMSAADRASKKDIYDLAYICEQFPLVDLWKLWNRKRKTTPYRSTKLFLISTIYLTLFLIPLSF